MRVGQANSLEALPRPISVLDAVYAAIRDSICDGVLEPGRRITQDDIADRLGVSRQPVGQALVLLKAQGFVSDTGRRGIIVAPLDVATVRDIYAIRGALDALAARLAAERATPDALAAGYDLIAAGLRSVSEGVAPSALVKADMDFHEFIYQLSGNALIRDSLLAHWHHLRRVMAGVVEDRRYLETLWLEHQHILDAIRDGDGERAAALSLEHVNGASQTLQKKLEARMHASAAGAAKPNREKNDGRQQNPAHSRDARQGRT